MTGAALATGLGAGASTAAEHTVPKDRSTIARPSVDSDDLNERQQAYAERRLSDRVRVLSEADLGELNQMRQELRELRARADAYYCEQIRRVERLEAEMRRMRHDGHDAAGEDLASTFRGMRESAGRHRADRFGGIDRVQERVDAEKGLRLRYAEQQSSLNDRRNSLGQAVRDGYIPSSDAWNTYDRRQQEVLEARRGEYARRNASTPALRREVRDMLSEPEQE